MIGRSQQLLGANLDAAELVAGSLQATASDVATALPITTASLGTLPRLLTQQLDSLLMRFISLEDILIGRVFRGVLIVELVDIAGAPPIDVLNQMEKRQIVKDAAVWRDIHKLRNSVVHEYPLDPERQTERLNAAYEFFPVLLDTTRQARSYVTRRRLLDPQP